VLETELGGVRGMIGRAGTIVPDEELEANERSCIAHKLQISLHYTHPFIVKESTSGGSPSPSEHIYKIAPRQFGE
jgi:hypothetical protein